MSFTSRPNIPGFIKPFLRLVHYRNERKKFVREFAIRKQQNIYLNKNYQKDTSHLIIFFVPGSDWATGKDVISGGTMSIVSICQETVALKEVHQAATIMCTMNEDHLLLKHEKFENSTMVFRFSQLKKYFTHLSSILIHIPEFMASRFQENLSTGDLIWLQKIPLIHLNVMNQNIKLMPEPVILNSVKKITSRITITTAHTQYCTPHYRQYYGVPLHKLSVWISPEQYRYTLWNDKESLLVVSPDPHSMKEEVLKMFAAIPGLTVQIIQNLTYQEYKKLISRAKWALTFGEGLDGYFIEPVFSGAIAFAVYNEDFFTPDFKELYTVYESIEVLKKEIQSAMKALDHPTDFVYYQKQQFDLCAQYYSQAQYSKNIAAFYKGEYTYA